MHHLHIKVALFLAAAAVALQAANWERWRGGENSGMASGDAPLRWSSTENIKWTAEIPGRAHSTPVIWQDRLFLTTAVPARSVEEVEAARRAATAAIDLEELRPELEAHYLRLAGGKQPSELTTAERRRITRQLGRVGAVRGTAAGIEHRFVVMALDRDTGETIWERTPVTETPHEGYHRRYGSFASISPVTDGERLYVSFGSRGLFAYDLNGSLAWKKDYGIPLQMAGTFGEGRSPALHGETLLMVFDHQGDSFISALDKRTGEERWRRQRNERSAWSHPLVTEHAGRTQAIVTASGKIRSYDLESGELIWECAGLGSNVIPAVVRDGDVVFAMSGHRDPNLLAIRLGGEGDVTGSDLVLWTNQRGNSYTPSPVIHEGILYFVTDRGLASAFDAQTGKPHYQQQRLPSTYSLKASPIAANGKLYIATEQGDVVVLRMGPEYEVLATNTIDGEFFVASPIIADGEIFLRGRNKLYAVSD